jgi:hypothetical protein
MYRRFAFVDPFLMTATVIAASLPLPPSTARPLR